MTGVSVETCLANLKVLSFSLNFRLKLPIKKYSFYVEKHLDLVLAKYFDFLMSQWQLIEKIFVGGAIEGRHDLKVREIAQLFLKPC